MTKHFATLEELQGWLRNPERRDYDIECILRDKDGFVLVAQKKKQAA